jgi:hypothetical protein
MDREPMMIHPKSGFGAILATALVLTGELPSGRIPHFSANSTTQIPRDTAAQKPGTATIRGRVVGVVDGLLSPIRSARVTLGSGPTTVEPVFTDDEGRFALSNLAAGRYTLTAEKTGFVKTRYGSRNEFDPPMPLDVADGAVVEGIEIGLPKGAAIIGRIVDELGDPVVAVPVSVGFVQVIGSETRFVPIARPASDTNDRGDYRIGWPLLRERGGRHGGSHDIWRSQRVGENDELGTDVLSIGSEPLRRNCDRAWARRRAVRDRHHTDAESPGKVDDHTY